MNLKKERKFNFRIGIPTIAAIVIAAVILIIFASPLKYKTGENTSDFTSLPIISYDLQEGDNVIFELPDASFFEKTTLTIDINKSGKPLTDISQIDIENKSSLFVVAATNIKIDGDNVYVIVTGFRQFIIAGSLESYGFALHLNR